MTGKLPVPFQTRTLVGALKLAGGNQDSSWGNWNMLPSCTPQPQVTTLIDAVSSPETIKLEQSIETLKSPPSPGALRPAVEKSVAENIFDATAAAKMLTAQVAMHLDRVWREKLFRQLDSLHDIAEWEEEDIPIQRGSFSTFLKAICQIQPERRPGLGLSSSGYLIAAWTNDDDRLTIEFLGNDRVRWVLTRSCEQQAERFAGQTSVARLYDGLLPYEPERWFSSAGKN
jgi:hypothetical protein